MPDGIENEDTEDEDFGEFEEVGDGWDEFRYEDREPIPLGELAGLVLSSMPDDIHIWVMDDYFPDTTITRNGENLICHIDDHMYTKYWQHRFSAYAFAEAMERAIVRLTREGHPFANPERDDEDVHIHVRWDLVLPATTAAAQIGEFIKAAYDLVTRRAITFSKTRTPCLFSARTLENHCLSCSGSPLVWSITDTFPTSLKSSQTERRKALFKRSCGTR